MQAATPSELQDLHLLLKDSASKLQTCNTKHTERLVLWMAWSHTLALYAALPNHQTQPARQVMLRLPIQSCSGCLSSLFQSASYL